MLLQALFFMVVVTGYVITIGLYTVSLHAISD